MLTKDGCENRRKRLFAALPEKPDWILIADPQHLMAYANYWQSPFVFRSNDAAAVLILGAGGESILIADSMSRGFVEPAFAGEKLAPTWYDGKHAAPHREGMLVRSTLERLKTLDGARIGYEGGSVPAGILEGLRAARPGVQLLDIDPTIRPLKRSKDGDELALLNRSMRAAEAGQKAALERLKPGMTELEAFLLVQEAATLAAGEQVVIYGDFVSGPRTEKVGGPPSDRKIAAGDLFILDFSAVLYHYRCDFANSFVVGGKPTDVMRKHRDACLEAMAAAESAVKAGTLAKEVDRACRESFRRKHLDVHFPHHAGHGIGLGHPEPPYLVPESDETLVAGDVITIEPGQYVAGMGGMRFERNYLVTETGFEILSKHELTLGGA
jgi:Xaa-Pro aminopeptidase